MWLIVQRAPYALFMVTWLLVQRAPYAIFCGIKKFCWNLKRGSKIYDKMVSEKWWKPHFCKQYTLRYLIISELKSRPGIRRLSVFESDVADRFQLAFQVVDDAVCVPPGAVHRIRTILLQSGQDRLTSMQKYISWRHRCDDIMTKTPVPEGVWRQ